MTTIERRNARHADIGLLLEGTYPFVSGGVSSWVASMLEAFPHYTFAIVFIGGRASDYDTPRYQLPDNVVHFQTLFLFDEDQQIPLAEPKRCPQAAMDKMRDLHNLFGPTGGFCGKRFKETLPLIFPGGPITEQGFLHGQQAWDETLARYEERCTDPSFTDYFWTVRIMHIPVWKLIKVAHELIPTKICHTVSTGYAGFLGALIHYRKNTPLLISEHGIYTKERQIDLFQSKWIHDNRTLLDRDPMNVSYFQDLWMRFFRTLGALAYDSADVITALYEGNQQRQLLDGALPERTRLVPNGIKVEKFLQARNQRNVAIPQVAALIGRVVPIKDIKTFIRSIFAGKRKHADLQGWIVGPEDEDPDYVQKCRDMIKAFGLEDRVHLLGFKNVRDVLSQTGVVVLSSISEGLPLVVLEAFAAGVPVVATDVGACKELVFGVGPQDAALGVAGRIVPMADPTRLANAIVELLSDSSAWHEAQSAGIARVERYYTYKQMVDTYENIYTDLIHRASTHAKPSKEAAAWQA